MVLVDGHEGVTEHRIDCPERKKIAKIRKKGILLFLLLLLSLLPPRAKLWGGGKAYRGRPFCKIHRLAKRRGFDPVVVSL